MNNQARMQAIQLQASVGFGVGLGLAMAVVRPVDVRTTKYTGPQRHR